MDGTRYVDGVLIDTSQLTRTEASKSFHILLARLTTWETGIHAGLRITVNTVNTSRIDIAAGDGYAVNGEYVEVLADQLNIQLANNALGALNLVVAFYTETKATIAPHETNGTTRPTENKRGIRIRVLEPAQLALLPIDDPTYTVDAQNRALLIGIVTATGGALSAANIEQPLPWRSLKHGVMGVPALAGVTIYQIADTMPEGATGALKLEIAPYRISWQAPTEAGFGPSVTIVADGVYTLTSLGGSTMQVIVVVAALPLANAQVQVSINGMYTQAVPRMSGTDRHHRSLLGTGVPGPSNPHGLSLDDISPGFATDILTHQQLMHSNGIWRGSAPSCLKIGINETGAPDHLIVTAPVGNDCYWVHGKRMTSIKNTALLFSGTQPDKRSVFEVYVDNAGNVRYAQRLEHTGTNLPGENNGIVFLNDAVTTGVHSLLWIPSGLGQGGYLSFDGGAPVRVPAGTAAGLYLLRQGQQEVWYYIADINALPFAPGAYSDVITILPPVSRSENLMLAQVFWGGTALTLGYTNMRGTTAALCVDTRLFGTLTADAIRDDALSAITEAPTDEHHANGVCLNRTDTGTYLAALYTEKPATGLTVSIYGQAVVYVKGRRFSLGSALPMAATVADNESTVLYVDINGKIAQAPLTLAAFLWTNTAEAFDTTAYYKTISATYVTSPFVYTGTPLSIVTTAAGNVEGVIDMRRNLSGGNINVLPWTVGDGVNTEFLNLDAALIYALAQGQDHIECINATLQNPFHIPDTKKLTLSGSIKIQGDWSPVSAVFQVGEGAALTLENLNVLVDATNPVAPGLSLIATTASNVQQSVITIDNVVIDWAKYGHIVNLVATGPTQCIVQVDYLTTTCAVGAPSLFQIDAETKWLQLKSVSIKTGNTIALVGASTRVRAHISHCYAAGASNGLFQLVGAALLDTCTLDAIDNFDCITATANVTSTVFSNCRFDEFTIINALYVTLSNCTFTTCNIGSDTHEAIGAILTGCTGNGAVVLYATSSIITGCLLSTLNFSGSDISVADTTCMNAVPVAAANGVHFSNCKMSSLVHTTPHDFFDWSIQGGSIRTIEIRWAAENVSNFTVSNCKITDQILLSPVAASSACKDLQATFQGCTIDFSSVVSVNMQLNFCKNVRILDNVFACKAQFTHPTICLGTTFSVAGQDIHDIDIRGNTFNIVDVIPGMAGVGSPVILVCDKAPSAGIASGIQVVQNRFVWRNSTATQQVTCCVYIGSFVHAFRIDNNTLIQLGGDTSDTTWATALGNRTASRLAMFIGYSVVGADYTCLLGTVSMLGNTFESSISTRWICYSFSDWTLGGQVMKPIANISGLAMFANPPFDNVFLLLNDAILNT